MHLQKSTLRQGLFVKGSSCSWVMQNMTSISSPFLKGVCISLSAFFPPLLFEGNILIPVNLLSLKPSVPRYPHIISSTYTVNNKRGISPISLQPCFVFSLTLPPGNPLPFSVSQSFLYPILPMSHRPNIPGTFPSCSFIHTGTPCISFIYCLWFAEHLPNQLPWSPWFSTMPPDFNAFESSGCLCCEQL